MQRKEDVAKLDGWDIISSKTAEKSAVCTGKQLGTPLSIVLAIKSVILRWSALLARVSGIPWPMSRDMQTKSTNRKELSALETEAAVNNFAGKALFNCGPTTLLGGNVWQRRGVCCPKSATF